MAEALNRLERYRLRLAKTTDPDECADLQAIIADLETQVATITTSGGDVVGGNKDERQGTFIGGNQVTLFAPGAAPSLYVNGVMNLYTQVPDAPPVDYTGAMQRYLNYLYAKYAVLDLRGIDDRPVEMRLTEIYISLHLHEPPADELLGRGGLRRFMNKVRHFFTGNSPDEEAATEAETLISAATPPAGGNGVVDWSQVLRHPRLAVIGAPGSGKTTLLHYTTVRLAEALAHDDRQQLTDLGFEPDAVELPPVPLLLPLRELGSFVNTANDNAAAGANPDLLLDCLTNYYARCDLNLPKDFFRVLCNEGRAILLLDGLDEVMSLSDRAFVSQIVRNVTERYPTCRYVVTARVAAYHGDAQIGGDYCICTIADLDEEQQQRFIANWSRSVHRLVYQLAGEALDLQANRYADDLWKALVANQRVRTLASNPLLLTVVAVIFYNNYVLPEDRAALYEECVEVLLRGGRGKADRTRAQRGDFTGDPAVTMGLDPKRELLAALAYRMHQAGKQGTAIARDDLVRTLTVLMRERGYAEPATLALAFVKELPVHLGLLDEREPDRFRFSHLSFQEFLAARHIAEDTDDRWNELLDHYTESWWREVIMLCAGHLSQARCWRFLAQLAARGTTPLERANALALASDALAELERFKGQGTLRVQIQAEALRIFSTSTAPAAARVTCGRALARVGDPRPGVATLPPTMVRFVGAAFQLGNTAVELERIVAEERGTPFAKNARDWYKDTVTDEPVVLRPFTLACYPVTNAQYALFMAAEGYNLDAPWWDAAGRTWLTRNDASVPGLASWRSRVRKDQPALWRDEQFGQERTNHPVVGVTWYEASAFCRWLTHYLNDGGVYRLPSEAEWEYAARGMQRRTYAWGNEPLDDERANYNERYNGTSAVGSFPLGATPDGLWDMTGNVWEWTRSEYRPYPYDSRDGREEGSDPAQKVFTLRGGSWGSQPFDLRASFRRGCAPDSHFNGVGFRVSRYPQV